MKKLLLTALMVCIAWGAFAQTIDASKVDLSKAEMSLAGPDSVYVSNIYYGATRLSVVLKYNGTTGATIYGPYYDDDKLLLDSFEFGQAELRLQGDSTLIISNLDLYGSGVSGRFSYDGVYTLDLTSWWQTEKPVSYQAQAMALAEQLETAQKRYEEEIAATKSKYMADVAELEADNTELEADVAELTADVAKLESTVASYETQIAALRRQAVTAAAGDDADKLLENMMFAGGVDKSMIDVSKAEMSLAGPDSIYVTNIFYGDVRMSVLLKYDGITGATIYGPYYDNEKFLLDTFEMGYADIRAQGENTLIISDLVLYGQGITGRFEYDGRSTLNLKSWWESTTPTTMEAQIAKLQADLADAKSMSMMASEESAKTIADLESTLNDLYARIEVGQKDYEDQIAALKRQVAAGGGRVMAPTPTRQVLTVAAAARATSLSGTWDLSETALTQTDATQLFAKFAAPLNQRSDQTLYSFTARAANATEKVGYGAHIFVSGDKSTLSWGLGNSYLIWVTRDPKFYRNDNTYIQIYRSYDDITMVQVASVATSENIARSNDVEILYDKDAATISVSMNGTLYVTYDVVDVIESGSKVAARTLGGPVTFSNASVKAK